MQLVFVHWLDCPTGPGFVHFCSCICEGIGLSHSGIHHLSESVAACAGHMPPVRQRGVWGGDSLLNQQAMTGYATILV